jgi:hypothetical protein
MKRSVELWDKKSFTILDMHTVKVTGTLKPAEQTARDYAYLIMNTFRGDSLEILLDAIAAEIQPMLDSEDNIAILKSKHDLANRARIAINQLAE